MLKYSTHTFLITVAAFWIQAFYAKVLERNLVQDVAVDFVVQSWKDRNDIPEPYRSKAIEQIKAIKTQEWKGLANFFIQLLSISEAQDKVAAKPSVIETETGNNNDESMEDIIKQLFTEILLMGATSSEEPVLEKRFKDAMEMKFKSIDDFGQYCIKVFKEVTGRTSPNKGL